jgi:hypothetical protein
MRKLFGDRNRRQFIGGRELATYRNELVARTDRVDALLGAVAEDIDALRRRALEPDEAVTRLTASEAELEPLSDELREMLAPEELHGLHMEYEANLERALRGITIVARGCGLTRLPHRPPEDEEAWSYFKRGHLNVQHSQLRMREIVEVLVDWEPGKPAEASVAARLHRDRA